MKRWLLAAALTGMVAMAALPVAAQEAGGGAAGGGRGGRGGFDPTQFRAQMEERTKTALGATDEEWKAIQPRWEKVNTLRMQAMIGGFGGFGGRGGRGGREGGGDAATSRPANPVAEKSRELSTLLENKDATPEQIKAKLDALREAKKKAADDLKKAQDELKEILTARQEAVLVSRGTLD